MHDRRAKDYRLPRLPRPHRPRGRRPGRHRLPSLPRRARPRLRGNRKPEQRECSISETTARVKVEPSEKRKKNGKEETQMGE